MKRNLICGALCLSLCLPAALAAETTFSDVKEDDWFAPYVSICVEHGLMNGTDNGFQPEKVLTNGEAAALAARIREKLTGQAIVFPAQGETVWPWTYPYTSYLEDAIQALGGHEEAARVIAAPVSPATRSGFMALLALATHGAEDSLPAINAITALPDTDNADVLRFYNAGILTGTDSLGTFSPVGTLTRSEAAAMIARILEPDLRVEFQPVDDTVAMTVDGVPILKVLLESCIENVIYQNDLYLYQTYRQRLTWGEDYGVGNLGTFLLTSARQYAVQIGVEEAKAQTLGILSEELDTVLVPAPDESTLRTFAQNNDLLCAKHILVADESTAQSVIAALDSQPTPDQFNAILSVLGTDPGMAANPNGYLFTAGEMVEPFEAGTRALAIGAYSSEPVQSSFGYHVILRLDPVDHPDLAEQYHQAAYSALVSQWMAEAQITVNQAVMDTIDVKAIFDRYQAGR